MTILVTGATGTVGRQVAEELLRMGRRVRALTRDPVKAALPAGVEVVAGDLGRPDSLAGALDGATALHLINADGAGPLPAAGKILARARAAGVRRLTTFRGLERGALEQAAAASGLGWTDLFVPVEFMANALHWAGSIRAEGVVRSFGPAVCAMIHEADIGAVAARALTEDGLAGRTLVLTGPEALTPADKVRILAEATGVAIRYEALSEVEARAKWVALGYPPEVVDALAGWYRDTPEIARVVRPTVREITGRPARRFADWAAEHRQAFRPEPADRPLAGWA
ncbi:uncharacterized protein YbjT (DUF2867 family) [Inquilinus ginsengisoli]|uniref:NmrA family NAD(P)-binding protein n=1 Tax=Inquilinus ginsengisoli TaxID=363840 RepID=UPI003D22F739